MSTILYRVSVTYKPIPTRLAYAQNAATVVPVNDIRTQCTTSLPPHKEAAVLRRKKNSKGIPRNKSRKPCKTWPCPNQGSYYHNGCGPIAQSIGPSTRDWHCLKRFPHPHKPPTSSGPLASNALLASDSPKPPLTFSPGSLWSAVDANPLPGHGASNFLLSEEHFGDAIQVSN